MNKAYKSHIPSEEGKAKIDSVREAFSNLDELVQELAPNSREKSIALTHLETACMFTVKAITHNDPDSKEA